MAGSNGSEAEALRLVDCIQAVLTDDLLQPRIHRLKDPNDHRTFGHCYVASEVLYHLWGKHNGFKPVRLRLQMGGRIALARFRAWKVTDAPRPRSSLVSVVHWWLKHDDKRWIDPTADQFAHILRASWLVPPGQRSEAWHMIGRGGGFLTKAPSSRALVVIDRLMTNGTLS